MISVPLKISTFSIGAVPQTLTAISGGVSVARSDPHGLSAHGDVYEDALPAGAVTPPCFYRLPDTFSRQFFCIYACDAAVNAECGHCPDARRPDGLCGRHCHR